MKADFSSLFDEWSESYDDTVRGDDVEYRDVFVHYEEILDAVVHRVGQTVLEFGVGTGNLSEKLVAQGKTVYGVEPSAKMRAIAAKKVPTIHLQDGHFLKFQSPAVQVDAIVSSYAFHHLTDGEKEQAIAKYAKLLGPNGKVVFADTVFEDTAAYQAMIQEAQANGYDRLVADLQTEFYTTLPVLAELFTKHGFRVNFKRKNKFVFIIEAVKGEF